MQGVSFNGFPRKPVINTPKPLQNPQPPPAPSNVPNYSGSVPTDFQSKIKNIKLH